MKYAVVLSCLIVSAFAAVADERSATILRSDVDSDPEGNFHNSFETSNGISAQNVGSLKELEPGVVALIIQGENSYTAPEGQVIRTGYTADENGYHPYGDHLPTPPPTPDAILKSLQYQSARA